MLRCRTMKGQVRRVVLVVAWLAIAALISLGAAGIIGAMAHLPGTASRAELTYQGDKAIEPGLTSAEASLVDLAGDVRHGSVKRVASAVGEGSICIRLVHEYLAAS